MKIDDLMKYIRTHKKVTIPEVQQKFGLKYGETREAFRQLQGEGKIRYTKGVTFEWCLIDEKERMEFIKQRRKEIENMRTQLVENVHFDDGDDDDDLDELFELFDEDDDEEPPVENKTAPQEPQPVRELVTLHNMLHCDEFKNSQGKLAFALGKDTNGKNIVVDLADMPNLLIAGTTGSGKSAILTNLIVSLAKKYSPDYVKFLLVDTKGVELVRYTGIPHLLTRDTIFNCTEAMNALDYLTEEMERRYGLFRASSVGNITEYNQQSANKLPYLVFVVDELADLMSDNNKRLFEVRIMRLSQKCRASGIHLVLATQRPDVSIVTGTIKASMPARIVLKVCSKYDSMAIIGQAGAEELLGRGDMLFFDGGSAKLKRIQGAYFTGEEIRIAANEFKHNFPCKFDKEAEDKIFGSKKEQTTATVADNSQADPLCRKALKYWLEKQGGRASIASIQRNLGIGFNRAGRIMDYCQKMGYVEVLSPNEPTWRPLAVLITLQDLPILFPDQED